MGVARACAAAVVCLLGMIAIAVVTADDLYARTVVMYSGCDCGMSVSLQSPSNSAFSFPSEGRHKVLACDTLFSNSCNCKCNFKRFNPLLLAYKTKCAARLRLHQTCAREGETDDAKRWCDGGGAAFHSLIALPGTSMHDDNG